MSEKNTPKEKPIHEMTLEEIIGRLNKLEAQENDIWKSSNDNKWKLAEEIRQEQRKYINELTERYRNLMKHLRRNGFASDSITVTITDISEFQRIRYGNTIRVDPMFRIVVTHPTRNTFVANTLSQDESLRFIEWIKELEEGFRKAVLLTEILQRFHVAIPTIE